MNPRHEALIKRMKAKRNDKRSLALSKASAHDYYKQHRNHKKLQKVEERKSTKNPEYAKMSIEDWEKKYGV